MRQERTQGGVHWVQHAPPPHMKKGRLINIQKRKVLPRYVDKKMRILLRGTLMVAPGNDFTDDLVLVLRLILQYMFDNRIPQNLNMLLVVFFFCWSRTCTWVFRWFTIAWIEVWGNTILLTSCLSLGLDFFLFFNSYEAGIVTLGHQCPFSQSKDQLWHCSPEMDCFSALPTSFVGQSCFI